jgi:hypothetical protein
VIDVLDDDELSKYVPEIEEIVDVVATLDPVAVKAKWGNH